MARCGCSGTCSCVLTPGDNVDITGHGTPNDPYVISSTGGGGGGGSAIINDSAPSLTSVYSSTKTEAVVTSAASIAATAAAAAKESALTTTSVKTANYNAGPNEIIPVDATAASRTITLPTTPTDKTRVVVKKLDSSANTVVIARGGADVFNKTGGSTTLTLSITNQSLALQYDAARSVWTVLAGDIPVGGLDVRYPVLDTAGHVPVANAYLGAAVFITKSGANWKDLAGNTITTRPTGAQLMISISTDGTTPSFANTGDLALTVPA